MSKRRLPASFKGKKPVGFVNAPRGIDPTSYAATVRGDCMSPQLNDGDVVVISPKTVVRPGMIVAFSFKSGAEGTIKRLKSELFKPATVGSNCQLLITVEMDNPREQFFIDPCKIDQAQAVIGVVRDGVYLSIVPPPQKAQSRIS
jgi:hypothetical protein